ncbi:hypothetical protein PIB30_001026 [Stylosanthes scabra]|uniref:Pectinesterase n=1 Tax=Stylosanthes scabra TaxID=79078 RepID=A0ABU6T2E9_9FABA|nr:hypothetical protein [Stylosanthes scabra]
MATIGLLLNFLVVPFFLSTFVFGYSPNEVKQWCSQTPNPQPCEYFLSNNSNPTYQAQSINQKSDFLKISLQLARDRALIEHANILSLGSECRNQLERVAWNDCVELYELTIHKLNKILDPKTKYTQFDVQTWLSAALTNLETCKDGFNELGVQDNLLPLIMSNNVTELLSNTLALNSNNGGESHLHQESSYHHYKDGFPTWVKQSDRKLLQASSPVSEANVVVAKDGSGKYTTVTAAINDVPKNGSESFEGYQDTLYVHAHKQFYRECDIYGTVDFIFGDASAVFQNCNIYARNPPNKTNTITAQGRTNLNQTSGIIIDNCVVTSAPDLKAAVPGSVKTYLGRPWKEYSRTVFINSFLDSLIDPACWSEWNNSDFALNTLYYGEYMNKGPGSSTANRVNWSGYHVITNETEALQFSVGNFIDGNSWLPSTHVPFNITI